MSTYTGSNQQLQYDATTGTWSLTNVAQNFVDTSTFSTVDPKFKYLTADDSNDDNTTVDPCPLGYILKDGACVVDPNYVPPPQASSGRGGSQPAFTPKQQNEYDLNREALESFSALKDKIDFDSYDPKTKTVKLKNPKNKNLLETVLQLTSPGTMIANIIFDAKDKADLSAVEFGGVKAYSKNEAGEDVINLEVLYNNLQTKVLNPGVPEGNILAGTPSYYGTDDTNGFYKTFFTSYVIPKEQRKFFGATSIQDIFTAAENARKATGMFPKSYDEGYEGPRSDIKYTTSGSDDKDSRDGGDDTPPPRLEGTTEPGSGYQAGASQYTRPAGTTEPGSGYQAGASYTTRGVKKGTGASGPPGFTPKSKTPTGINRPGRD
jgi:hypothetical protein